jgi:hypothetical protein
LGVLWLKVYRLIKKVVSVFVRFRCAAWNTLTTGVAWMRDARARLHVAMVAAVNAV